MVGRAVEDGAYRGSKGAGLAVGMGGRSGSEERTRRRRMMMGVGLMKLELMSDRSAALALNLLPIHAGARRASEERRKERKERRVLGDYAWARVGRSRSSAIHSFLRQRTYPLNRPIQISYISQHSFFRASSHLSRVHRRALSCRSTHALADNHQAATTELSQS